MYRKLQVIYMFIILFIQILCRQIYVQSMYNQCTIYVQIYIQISTITAAKLFFIDGLCDLFIHVDKESS